MRPTRPTRRFTPAAEGLPARLAPSTVPPSAPDAQLTDNKMLPEPPPDFAAPIVDPTTWDAWMQPGR